MLELSRSFDIFFIPVFKYSKEYIIVCNKCRSVYKVKGEKILQILKTKIVEYEDIEKIILETNTCPYCGTNIAGSFSYCPKCGKSLKESNIFVEVGKLILATLKGVITGLILSLPFGPVGIYCMEKTMIEGQKKGYISALGMVTIDIFYGLIALYFNSCEDIIVRYESMLQIFVAIFLSLLGGKS